jgi:hypothetical protein
MSEVALPGPLFIVLRAQIAALRKKATRFGFTLVESPA